jgi:hypothetical protein
MTSKQGEGKEFVEWLERWRTEIHSHATAEHTLPDEQAKSKPGRKKVAGLERKDIIAVNQRR